MPRKRWKTPNRTRDRIAFPCRSKDCASVWPGLKEAFQRFLGTHSCEKCCSLLRPCLQSPMQARNPLFCEEDLDTQLRGRQQRVSSIVDGIPKDQFLIPTDEELVQHIIPQLAVEPIVLDEGRKSMNQQETKVDVSHDFGRAILDYNRNHPVYVNGTRWKHLDKGCSRQRSGWVACGRVWVQC